MIHAHNGEQGKNVHGNKTKLIRPLFALKLSLFFFLGFWWLKICEMSWLYYLTSGNWMTFNFILPASFIFSFYFEHFRFVIVCTQRKAGEFYLYFLSRSFGIGGKAIVWTIFLYFQCYLLFLYSSHSTTLL